MAPLAPLRVNSGGVSIKDANVSADLAINEANVSADFAINNANNTNNIC